MAKVSKSILKKIQNDAARRLPNSRRISTNLYIQDEVIKRRTTIKAHRQKISVPKNSVMVFADDEPEYNWAHDCRYLLYGVANGDYYNEVASRFPPYLAKPPDTFNAFHQPVVVTPIEKKIWPLRPPFRLPFIRRRGRRYAVLFSGASNNRHVNDLEFLYRTLVDIYYFAEDDVYVLNFDGSVNYNAPPQPVETWPGNDTAYRMNVRGNGTKSDLDDVLDELKGKIKKEDLLLIHTNNHGGHDGSSSYLCTYSDEDYPAPDFAEKLAEFPKFKDLIVMMEQCHSGGFNKYIAEKSTADRTSVASACLEHRSSIGGPDFDPFARDWIAAITCCDPYGVELSSSPDTSGDNKVSAIEAFNYADSIHHSYDTPLFTEASEEDGKHYLNQRYRVIGLYKEQIIKKLKPIWERMPEDEYTNFVKDKLITDLLKIETDYKEERDLSRIDLSGLANRIDEVIQRAID